MAPIKLRPRQQQIMDTLYNFGRVATTREISMRSNVPLLDVQEFLDGFSEFVSREEGQGYDVKWRIIKHYYKEK